MAKLLHFTLLMLFLGQFAQAQDLNYKRYFPLRMGNNTSLEDYDVKQTFRLSSSRQILVADGVKEDKDHGLHLLYVERDPSSNTYKVKYTSETAMQSLSLHPSFFRAQDGSIIVICSAGSEDKTWGENVYHLKDGTMKELGGMNIALENEEQYNSILPKLKITQQAEKIYFRIDGLLSMVADQAKDNAIKTNLVYVYENGDLHIMKEEE